MQLSERYSSHLAKDTGCCWRVILCVRKPVTRCGRTTCCWPPMTTDRSTARQHHGVNSWLRPQTATSPQTRHCPTLPTRTSSRSFLTNRSHRRHNLRQTTVAAQLLQNRWSRSTRLCRRYWSTTSLDDGVRIQTRRPFWIFSFLFRHKKKSSSKGNSCTTNRV